MVGSGLVISQEIIDACKKVQSNQLDALVLGFSEKEEDKDKLLIKHSYPKGSKKHPYRSISTTFKEDNARL